MTRKPRVDFAGGSLMCPGKDLQSIFKDLAKELHQDLAVLSRGLELAEELASKPELRGVMKTLYKSLRKGKFDPLRRDGVKSWTMLFVPQRSAF
jgi:hypothetical protein